MSDKMFCFDPNQYAEQFARDGYVHIKQGVTESFYRKMAEQVEQSMKRTMKDYAFNDKQQAMYEFPDGGDYVQEVCDAVAGVTGLPSDDIILSERHVKGYDADAAAEPNAHKDRYASQISLGLSVHVKEGSTLVLYPYDELDINPFNTSREMRSSLSTDRYPEPRLKKAKRIEIKDAARDVIMFRGHKIWHLRANPALTTMLYLKLNAFNCDPLGEDRRTEETRARTLASAEIGEAELERLVPLIGRRVDYIHKMYTRDWRELYGVVLWGEKHFSVDDHEVKLLRAIDAKRTVGALARAASESIDQATTLASVRRLARRGVIDLVPAKG
ncbi:MAG: hypothetical protein WBD40_25965 [Tepidisphaeraceae bacterium]